MASTEVANLDLASYNAFVEGLDLVGVEVIRLHAERTSAGMAERTSFELNASYRQDAALIHYRYDISALIADGEGISLGSAAASVVLTARASGTADAASIEQFGATSGALIAYPYLREAIASTAQHTGFPGVLLPMIKRQPDHGPGK